MNYLVKSDCGSYDKRQHIKQAEQSDKRNGKGRKKMKLDLDFFLDNKCCGNKKWGGN